MSLDIFIWTYIFSTLHEEIHVGSGRAIRSTMMSKTGCHTGPYLRMLDINMWRDSSWLDNFDCPFLKGASLHTNRNILDSMIFNLGYLGGPFFLKYKVRYFMYLFSCIFHLSQAKFIISRFWSPCFYTWICLGLSPHFPIVTTGMTFHLVQNWIATSQWPKTPRRVVYLGKSWISKKSKVSKNIIPFGPIPFYVYMIRDFELNLHGCQY